MDVSRFTRVLAAVSFVALTGCSDGSTVAPRDLQTRHVPTSAISRNPAFNSLLLPRPLGGWSAQSRATWPSASPNFFTHCKKQSPPVPNAYLFANESISARVYEYCEDIPPSPNTPMRSFGPGGFGLTISPVAIPAGGGANELLAVGEYPAVSGNPGAISIYRVLGSGLTPLVPPASKLVLTNANTYPIGLCFDGTGGLYATEYPTNQIDYWTNAQVVGVGVAPPPVVAALTTTGGPNPAPFYGTYLVCDFDQLSIPPGPPPVENIVMVDGTDSGGGVDVGKFVAGPAPTVNVSYAAGPGGFPGGLTLNKHDYLVFNDPNPAGPNSLITLFPPDVWNTAGMICNYGTPGSTYYLPIVFDDTQREIWGGNTIKAGSAFSTDAVSNYFPFGGVCQPGESGGPTKVIQNPAQFIGIAVWRNTGE